MTPGLKIDPGLPHPAEDVATRGDAGSGLACINPLLDASWDSRLEAFPQASFFHGSAWARVLHGTYGYAPTYLFGPADGTAPVALPLMEINSWVTGRRGITLPFTDECGALGGNPDVLQGVLRHMVSIGERRSWKYYELRGGSLGGELPPSVSYYGHRLELHPNTSAIFAGFDSAVRRAIRKGQQDGVTVEFASNDESIRTFYSLLCKTRSRHGLPPQPYRFFENIHRHILQEGKGEVVLARSGQTPVAGAVFFHAGKHALFKFGASDETFQQFRGNNLVLWGAIEKYAKAGFSALDFGRTSISNTGLRRFKLSWGSVERSIEYNRYDFRSKAFVTSADQASGSWHTRIFRALPLGFSRLIGAAAYKHLA